MDDIQAWDPDNPDLGPMVAISVPFWVRSLRTLFRERPACYQHRQIFKTREQYERHWLTKHRVTEESDDVA